MAAGVWGSLRRAGLVLGLLFASLAGLALAASAQTADQAGSVTLEIRGDESPETLRRLIDGLSQTGRPVILRVTGAPAATPAVAPPAKTKEPAKTKVPATTETPESAASGAASRIETFLEDFAQGFDYGNASIPAAVDLPGDWSESWDKNTNGAGSGLPASLRLILVLGCAVAAALLVRRATDPWIGRHLVPADETFSARLVASLWGLAQDVAMIVALVLVARAGVTLMLPDPDLAARTARLLGNSAAIGLSYLAAFRFLLAPGRPERRLLPLPRADWHYRLFAVYSLVTPFVVSVSILAGWVARERVSADGLVAVTGVILTLLKVVWFICARRDIALLVLQASPTPGPWLRLLAVLAPWLNAILAVLIWMVGRAAASMSDGERWAEAAALTQLAIILTPIFAAGVAALIRCRWSHHAGEEPPTPMAVAVGETLRAAAVGVVWVIGALYLTRLWTAFFIDSHSMNFTQILRQWSSIALVVFAAWLAVVFLRAVFDAYTPKRTLSMPGDDDDASAHHVPSRLATVLPVLRGVVLGAIAGLTALVVLSRLGIDIGPLLAGFGILGLAISFGSQALVRDIVSGFFFMIEDAFRVGEYVDTGRLKGTVEKISLRSMQLRHQSGQIHTVPFGQIPSLTNASRDWSTIKFNVRLDHTADIEKARKTVKKAGQALLEDPEFGPNFIAPLKMQGVADITDSAIVIRLKFTAKPAYASTLQREALKRVYRGFIEAGVPFASNAVTVRGGGEKEAAAAISAVPTPSPLAPAAG